jgi:hypothetical protein
MKFNVPFSSSAPQRPQLQNRSRHERYSVVARNRALVQTHQSPIAHHAHPVPHPVTFVRMVEYDPFSVDAMSDPFPLYRQLRALGPVYRLEQYDAWALPRFEEVWQVAQDRDNFSIVEGPVFRTGKAAAPQRRGTRHAAAPAAPSFAAVDPPLHTQLRQSMYPSFTPRTCRDLAVEVDEMVQYQLDALDGTDASTSSPTLRARSRSFPRCAFSASRSADADACAASSIHRPHATRSRPDNHRQGLARISNFARISLMR